MQTAIDPNEIGSGYSDDDLDSFDDDAALSQFTNDETPAGDESSGDDSTAQQDSASPTDEGKTDDDAPADEGAADSGSSASQEEEPGDAEEPTQTQQSDYWLPKSRYDYAQAKRREAEAELERVRQENAELQRTMQQSAQQSPPAEEKTDQAAELEAKLNDLDRQIEAARLDGDVDKAAQLAGEIRSVERQIFTTPGIDTDKIREEAANEARQQMLFDQAAAAIEKQYPVLSPEHSDYNKDTAEEVSDLFRALVREYDSVTALQRAVNYVMGPGQQPPPQPQQTKRKTDFKKNVEAAKRMPPEADGFNSDQGGPSRKLDPTLMSIEEFEALSDEDEERLLA